MAVAVATKKWTLEELHSLPDDGNKYELVHGELFVTPPPTEAHETIAARLTRILDPYVAANALGYVYHPKAVMRVGDNEVEPDLMVRQRNTDPAGDWAKAPKPSLIVEILSPSTRRRDHGSKKDFYMEVGVELWLVDPESRGVTVSRRGAADQRTSQRLDWTPAGASASLAIEVTSLFLD